ncbi:MAG: MFS transporter [Armatimonadota bacterium]
MYGTNVLSPTSGASRSNRFGNRQNGSRAAILTFDFAKGTAGRRGYRATHSSTFRSTARSMKPMIDETDEANNKQNHRPPHVQFNFAMGLIHGVLFRAGMAFSEPMSVLPVFLNHFTGSQAMIGVFSALMNAGSVLPQLFVANRLAGRRRKKPVLVIAIWIRAAVWLFLGLLAYFCPADQSTIVLVGLLVLLFAFSFAGGVATIPFTDIWGKALPATLRGRFFGHRQLWGGLLAVGAGYVVKQILGNPEIPFPRNYAFLFLLSFAFIAVSYVALTCLREPENSSTGRTRKLGHFLRRCITILRKHRNLRIFIFSQLAVGFATFAMPFYVLYGKNELHMAAEQVGILIGAQMAGSIVSNVLWAHLSDRVGNRIVIILTAVTAATIPLLALLSSGVGWKLLIGVFALIGFATSGQGIGFTNYLLEIAPERLRPTYIALRGTLNGLTIVWPILGGVVIDEWSYPVTFTITLIVLTAGLVLSLALKPVRSDNV